MRILQVTPRVAGPATDGGRIAMRNLALGLREAGAIVETLSLNPSKHRVEPQSAGCATIEIDTGRLSAEVLGGVASGLPPNVARFRSAALEREIERRAGGFDVVQLEELAMAQYAGAARRSSGAKVVLRPLNAESQVWSRLATRGPLPARAARRLLAAWLAGYEARVARRVDAVVAVSEGDAAVFRSAGAATHVAPVGLDLGAYPFSVSGSPEACVLGSLDYMPNIEGLEWLLSEVWPALREAGISLRVAGSGASDRTAALVEASGVEFSGFVPDARAFLGRHGVVLVPLLSGGGLRVKIIEAMALGKVVVTTPVGAEGLGIRDGVEAWIAGDAEAFAVAVRSAVSDPASRREMGSAARDFVERHFDASRIGRELLAFYGSLIAR